jgi:hypothetical protein
MAEPKSCNCFYRMSAGVVHHLPSGQRRRLSQRSNLLVASDLGICDRAVGYLAQDTAEPGLASLEQRPEVLNARNGVAIMGSWGMQPSRSAIRYP